MAMTDSIPNECEACSNSGYVEDAEGRRTLVLTRINGLWLCADCASLEQSVIEEKHSSEAMQQHRVDKMNESLLERSSKVDYSLQVRTDIFNAETVSIQELAESLKDTENPEYELAKLLTERLNAYKKLIFDSNNVIMETNVKQRTTQSYLNNLANKLRQEEREKLRLNDINYQPKPVLKPVKTSTISKKKMDKEELKKYAVELGVSEFTLQMVCIQKGITPEQAANLLRRSINEAKSE